MSNLPERPKRLRTFVAIGLLEVIKREISARLAVASVPSVTPIAVERLHVTLCFLGATLPTQLSPIESALAEVARGVRPFELLLKRVGAFPDERTPDTVWLGVAGELTELEKLAVAVGRALAPLGFPLSPRAFQAHVTLSRIRSAPDGVRLLSALREAFVAPVGPMRVESIALFRSETLPEGPRYTELASFPLG